MEPLSIVLFVLLAAGAEKAAAVNHPSPSCDCATDDAGCATTVLTPQWVTEYRTVCETKYRMENRGKTVICYKTIPVLKQVPEEYTVWVKVKKYDEQKITIKKPVFTWENQKCTVMTPGRELQVRVKTSEQCVTVPEVQTKREDHGRWVEQQVETCDECGRKSVCTKKVWQPCIVEKQEMVSTTQKVKVEEPYECMANVVVPIERHRRVKVYKTQKTEKTIKHPYWTVEPKKRTRIREVYIDEKVPYEKTEFHQVRVPYTVERTIAVRVCKMLPAGTGEPAHNVAPGVTQPLHGTPTEAAPDHGAPHDSAPHIRAPQHAIPQAVPGNGVEHAPQVPVPPPTTGEANSESVVQPTPPVVTN